VDGTPFLGTVGMLGTHYSDEHVATGVGVALLLTALSIHHVDLH
jgi:hypothetical protein